MSRLVFDCRLRYAGGFQLDASFAAGDGVTTLFGPSGAGKSTIFALIAGTLRPHEGSITLSDHVLVDTKAGVMLPPEWLPTSRTGPCSGIRSMSRTSPRNQMLEISQLSERFSRMKSGSRSSRSAVRRS